MALCNSRSQTTRGFCYGWYHLGGMELLCVAYYFGRKKGKKVAGSAKQQGILQPRENISHLSVSAAETFPASVQVQRN